MKKLFVYVGVLSAFLFVYGCSITEKMGEVTEIPKDVDEVLIVEEPETIEEPEPVIEEPVDLGDYIKTTPGYYYLSADEDRFHEYSMFYDGWYVFSKDSTYIGENTPINYINYIEDSSNNSEFIEYCYSKENNIYSTIYKNGEKFIELEGKYEFDEQGNVQFEIKDNYGGIYQGRKIEYDENGRVKKSTEYSWYYDNLYHQMVTYHITDFYDYNENGYVLASSRDSDTYYYEYDSDDKLIKEYSNEPNPYDLDLSTTYKYDSNGKLIEETRNYGVGKGDAVQAKTVIKYNENGDAISEKAYGYNDFYGYAEIDRTTTYSYEYDEMGNIISKTTNDVDKVSNNKENETVYAPKREYDENGNIISIIQKSKRTTGEETEIKILFEYDENNELLKIIVNKGGNDKIFENTYDEQGNPLVKYTCSNIQSDYDLDLSFMLDKEEYYYDYSLYDLVENN